MEDFLSLFSYVRLASLKWLDVITYRWKVGFNSTRMDILCCVAWRRFKYITSKDNFLGQSEKFSKQKWTSFAWTICLQWPTLIPWQYQRGTFLHNPDMSITIWMTLLLQWVSLRKDWISRAWSVPGKTKCTSKYIHLIRCPSPTGARKNASNEQNVRKYYTLNHLIRDLLFRYKKVLFWFNFMW